MILIVSQYELGLQSFLMVIKFCPYLEGINIAQKGPFMFKTKIYF